MSPTVSVIIPLYNKGLHIARAINSVLAQTVQDFEINVVDDHSSDEGPEIVKSYNDPRITFIEQDHRGVSYTRNHGVEQAKSDFIAFLDADDEWMPNHLQTLFRLKEKFPDAGLYTTSYKIYLKTGKIVNPHYLGIFKSPFEGLLPNYFESAAFGISPVAVSVVGLSKELFFEIGGFPVGESLGEDIDLWARIALKYSIAYSTDIGAIYHQEASNRAGESFNSTEELLFVKNAKNAIADGLVPQKMLPFFKEYIARKEIDTAIRNILAGDYTLARKILARTETRYLRLEKFKLSIITRIPKPIFDRMRYTKDLIIKII